MAAVGDFFPGMSPDDWDVLDKLYNESISACVACGLFADDSSREREDAAIEALVSFQKSHGLL